MYACMHVRIHEEEHHVGRYLLLASCKGACANPRTHEGSPPRKNDPTQMMECTVCAGYDYYAP